MEWKIPLFKIYWDDKDIEMVSKTIQRGMFWAIGPNVEQFERMLAQYVGRKYALVFNSGTSALHAVLAAYDIRKGDEVIVPSFTFIATANAPLFVGAKPVFADIEADTYGLDPEDIEQKITSRTRAIIPVHYGGCPCRIEAIREIARKHRLLLIEDAAESLGASIQGNKVGTFSDAAVFSFCSNKVITTGEGGVVLTDSLDRYERLKLIRSHGRAETANYFSSSEYMDYIELGYNFRMSDITAALGIAQLEKVDKIIEMRRRNTELMSAKLATLSEIETPNPPGGYFHVYQMYTIRVREKREKLVQFLAENGIMTKVYFHPVHLTSFYRAMFGFKGDELPVTEKVSSEILSLPLYPTLTIEDMEYVISKIEAFFN